MNSDFAEVNGKCTHAKNLAVRVDTYCGSRANDVKSENELSSYDTQSSMLIAGRGWMLVLIGGSQFNAEID